MIIKDGTCSLIDSNKENINFNLKTEKKMLGTQQTNWQKFTLKITLT